MQLKQLCYISILFPCLYFVVNAMCTLKKCLCLDLFVIVVKLCTCNDVQPVTEYLFHWTSTNINIKIKLILIQNYGWPIGPAKIWPWLADGRLGGLGPAGSTTPGGLVILFENIESNPTICIHGMKCQIILLFIKDSNCT